MRARLATIGLVAATLAGCASVPSASDPAAVAARERAFAATMARRDFASFMTFVSDEAIFMGPNRALRGKAAVGEAWRRFFEGPNAPFAWEPDQVEVLASGTLAWSTGPVRDPAGKVVARFQSVWRYESPGEWRIVLDKGTDVCACGAAKTP